MFNKILKWLLRNRLIYGGVKKIYTLCKSRVASMTLEIPEISSLEFVESASVKPRLNLLVPGISARAMFGGVSTALDVFLKLATNFENVRIIVTDETKPSSGIETKKLAGFSPSGMESDVDGKVVVWCGDRYAKYISVRETDHFVATAWWTAYIGFNIVDRQALVYNKNKNKIIYIIQDYEPNFYAWSSRFALAQSTYHRSSDTIAIVNSSLLKNYLDSRGHNFYINDYFEPKLNRQLLAKLQANNESKKEKLIFIYGRPSVQRNAFELVVQSLKAWASDGRAFESGWKLISAGEEHEDIDLGGNLKLVSSGKLSIDDYASLLERVAVGVSLMISPHPSYPPLELAAFGAGVITNKFDVKNLSLIHPSIYSVDVLNPSKIAETLAWVCHEFEQDNEIYWQKRYKFSWPYIDLSEPFEPDGALLHYLDEILS